MLEQHELTTGLHPTHFGKYIRKEGFIERPEGIDSYILIICESGHGFFGFEKTKHKILPGDIMIIPAGCPHSYGSEQSMTWNINWTHYSGRQAGAFMNRPVILHPPESIFNQIQSIYNDYYKCVLKDMKLQTLITASQILRHLLGAICFSGAESQPEARIRQAVDKAIDLMLNNLSEALSLQEMAKNVNLSVSRFSVIFKEGTGLSPIEYFNNLKVRHACHYLDTTDLSIGQISEIIGIENPHYFSRMFSKSTGLSPREYRKLKLQL